MSLLPNHIVIIARHYPPLISGGGRRVFLWVKTLRSMGIRVSVVAPIVSDGNEGISVSHPQPEPDLISQADEKPSAKDFLRTWLLYPDNDVNWCRRAARAARREWPEGVDWVITTSPPESVHVAGRYLQKHLKCKWHADIRDFWLEHPLIKVRRNPLRRWIEAKIAKQLLSKADVITAVSPDMRVEASDFSHQSIAFILSLIYI